MRSETSVLIPDVTRTCYVSVNSLITATKHYQIVLILASVLYGLCRSTRMGVTCDGRYVDPYQKKTRGIS